MFTRSCASNGHFLLPQGVKTNVVFMTRGKSDKANTRNVWVYDMRANMDAFGKTRLLTVDDFKPFEKAFGGDPNGDSRRKDQGEAGRFRCFVRDSIKARSDNLDIGWLRNDDGEAEDTLSDPQDIAAAIMSHLKSALAELETVQKEIGEQTATDTAQ